jgi:Domain of unknown function (DUF4138)
MKTLLSIGFTLMCFVGRTQGRPGALDAKPTMHRKCEAAGISLELRGIYIQAGLMWFVLRATNRTAIDFKPATMHFTIRDQRSFRRRASQELRLESVYSDSPLMLFADSSALICCAVKPRVPHKHQQLILTWGDRNGDRRLEMALKANALLHAKPIK